MSASEVAPNPFWYAKSTAALSSRDRLSICVLAMFAPKSVNQLVHNGGRQACQASGLVLASRTPLSIGAQILDADPPAHGSQNCTAKHTYGEESAVFGVDSAFAGARARVVSGPSGWPLAFGLRDEHRAHPEECNRADWRSTLRYAAAAKRRWKREIVRLPSLRSGSAQRLV